MLQLLRERDRQGAIPTHTLYEESLSRVASRVLKRIQKGYDTKRMLKIRGDEGEFEVFAFQGADLRSNTDVVVKPESSVPDSRFAREQMVLRKFEIGYYGNPADPEVQRRVQKMLDDAVHRDIFNDEYQDEMLVKFENKNLIIPEVKGVPVNEYDNHGLHLKGHNEFRRNLRYQRLKLENPEVFMYLETKFMEHTLNHQAYLQAQQDQMIQRQAQLQSYMEAFKEGGEKSGGGKGTTNRSLATGSKVGGGGKGSVGKA